MKVMKIKKKFNFNFLKMFVYVKCYVLMLKLAGWSTVTQSQHSVSG